MKSRAIKLVNRLLYLCWRKRKFTRDLFSNDIISRLFFLLAEREGKLRPASHNARTEPQSSTNIWAKTVANHRSTCRISRGKYLKIPTLKHRELRGNKINFLRLEYFGCRSRISGGCCYAIDVYFFGEWRLGRSEASLVFTALPCLWRQAEMFRLFVARLGGGWERESSQLLAALGSWLLSLANRFFLAL